MSGFLTTSRTEKAAFFGGIFFVPKKIVGPKLWPNNLSQPFFFLATRDRSFWVEKLLLPGGALRRLLHRGLGLEMENKNPSPKIRFVDVLCGFFWQSFNKKSRQMSNEELCTKDLEVIGTLLGDLKLIQKNLPLSSGIELLPCFPRCFRACPPSSRVFPVFS